MFFPESSRNEKKIILCIMLVALGLRVALMVYLQTYVIEDEWSFGYETGSIAKSIATGEGFSSPFLYPTGPTAWMAPVYPYFLAFIFKIFGVYTLESAIVALTINALISALTCIPLYYISKDVFGRGTGYISLAAFAFHPPSIWYSINMIWNTTLFTFLALVLIYWLYRLPQRLNFKSASLYGLFIGFVALVSPLIIIFYPVVLIWLFMKSTYTPLKRIKYIAAVFIMAFIVLMPWLFRNYVVFDRLMLKSNFSVEFRIGNNPMGLYTHPTSYPDELMRYTRLGEMGYIDWCYDETMKFINENPRRFLMLTLERFNEFWLGTNLVKPGLLTGVKRLSVILPLPFMIVGLFLAIKRRLKGSLPIMAFILLLPAVYYITHVLHRYRYPIEPIVLTFAGYGLYSLYEIFRRRL